MNALSWFTKLSHPINNMCFFIPATQLYHPVTPHGRKKRHLPWLSSPSFPKMRAHVVVWPSDEQPLPRRRNLLQEIQRGGLQWILLILISALNNRMMVARPVCHRQPWEWVLEPFLLRVIDQASPYYCLDHVLHLRKVIEKKKEKRANCENCVSPWKLERSGETTTRINPDGHGRSEQLCVCPGEKKKGSAESIGSFFSWLDHRMSNCR